MAKPGQEDDPTETPSTMERRVSCVSGAQPRTRGPGVADMSPEKQQPKVPWRRREEERAGDAEAAPEQPLVSGPAQCWRRKEQRLVCLWQSSGMPAMLPRDRMALRRGMGCSGERGHEGHSLLDRKEVVVWLPLEKNANVLPPNASQYVCVSVVISLFCGPDASHKRT